MISLILPYWCRKAATDKSLAMMASAYPSLDFEVVIVDDGSPESYHAPAGLPWPVNVIHLPKKTDPRSACVPYNVGARAARGDYIALSSPEIQHPQPVFPAMLEEIQTSGPNTQVLAACWNPEHKRWHCHSTRKRGNTIDVGWLLPPGADYHFCSLMHRSLWDRIGGMDDDYRIGTGYEDSDLCMRLHRAGARFVIRDDLVVIHPREGAHAAWRPEMFAKNRKLFLSKWAPS